MPKVTFLPDDVSIEVREGLSLFGAAIEADVGLESQCGGKGGCALCRVIIREGVEHLSEMQWEERNHLGNVFHITQERLACQTRVRGDVIIEIPEPIERPKKLYAPRMKAGLERILQARLEAEESNQDASRAVKGRTRRRRRRSRDGGAPDSSPSLTQARPAQDGNRSDGDRRDAAQREPDGNRRGPDGDQRRGEDRAAASGDEQRPAHRGRRRQRPRKRRSGGNRTKGGGGGRPGGGS